MSRVLLPWLVVSVLGRALAAMTADRPGGGPIRRAIGRWLRIVAWLLQYEPSWFAEFGLGLGAMLWGAGAMLTATLGSPETSAGASGRVIFSV